MLGPRMLTFEDFQNKILAAIGVLLLSGATFVVVKVVNAPTKDDVEKMISRAQETGYYTQDRNTIQKSIQDLFNIMSKVSDDQERLKGRIDANNDKIILNNEKLWAELALLRIEMEKIKMRQDYSDDKKKRSRVTPPSLDSDF